MSLVNDNSVQAGYDRNAVIPTQQCYRYKKRELEGDQQVVEKERVMKQKKNQT